jgi:hypothetical protein
MCCRFLAALSFESQLGLHIWRCGSYFLRGHASDRFWLIRRCKRTKAIAAFAEHMQQLETIGVVFDPARLQLIVWGIYVIAAIDSSLMTTQGKLRDMADHNLLSLLLQGRMTKQNRERE